MPITLLSNSFGNEDFLPVEFTFQGRSINPHLKWSNLPAGTQEIAIICEDPDAPSPSPIVHWIIYGIDPRDHEIPAGLPKHSELTSPIQAKQGLNSFFISGYIGPNPNFWHGPHRYIFRIFALDKKLDLEPNIGRSAFLKSIQGHILEESKIIALYEKTPFQKLVTIGIWALVIGTTGETLLGKLRKTSWYSPSLSNPVLGALLVTEIAYGIAALRRNFKS